MFRYLGERQYEGEVPSFCTKEKKMEEVSREMVKEQMVQKR